ncbi:unnamed protein product [Moneuplotes crassus]|uniref:Uncharacterized protein n=1 Tax=Euplotes crassus TaxID=5936 RepID=A0AAD1XWR2_EUPCR|nr:unnamed protein product [Moneuplotes crassus]
MSLGNIILHMCRAKADIYLDKYSFISFFVHQTSRELLISFSIKPTFTIMLKVLLLLTCKSHSQRRCSVDEVIGPDLASLHFVKTLINNVRVGRTYGNEVSPDFSKSNHTSMIKIKCICKHIERHRVSTPSSRLHCSLAYRPLLSDQFLINDTSQCVSMEIAICTYS